MGRQYTGTSGKIDNCQIGVFAAYATSSGRALVDRELYLPKAWTSDRDRCRAAKIPDERGFATKGELARGIVRRCMAAGLPAKWVTADEAYGQDWHFRRLLEQLDIGYVVAVPKSQQIKSLAGIWRIDQLIDEAPGDAWQRLSCGDGAKGPRVYDWAAAKLPANLIFDPDPPTHHRWVMARRSLSDPGLQKRISLGPAHRGRDTAAPGCSPAPPASRPRSSHPRAEVVGLEKTPPGRRPPLPLPKTQLRTRSAAGVLDRVRKVPPSGSGRTPCSRATEDSGPHHAAARAVRLAGLIPWRRTPLPAARPAPPASARCRPPRPGSGGRPCRPRGPGASPP
ncbi:IS4 family transposase [Streptomyces collinus Tu 365]|uniref:IS4 family transposase n=1 Tax=Streptomyces collinus (strain DSM 40733 / Tue 365) TaxID=1214242 RepID=S5VEG6_STRC3|nr:IS4 family transposase [Streptomyces collinus Tu 365]